ncbi:MAG: hypothetical protein H6869_12120 [Rhodospirillales bacterium]|nr:hypothetical protein [Rhodospirillales bacterium]
MRKLLIPALITVLTGFSAPAQALEGRWSGADYIQARLLSAADALGGEETALQAGLHIKLADGWHAYWRMPGEGGLPPVLHWDNAANVEAVTVRWPVPQRFETFGLYSFGYTDEVILPLEVTLTQPETATRLDLRAEIMVCNEICVPQKIQAHLDIPAGPLAHGLARKTIEEAALKVPQDGDRPTLKIENMVAGPEAIVVTAFSQNGYDQADLFIECGDLYITAPPEITPDEKDPRRAMIRVAAPEGTDNLADYVTNHNVTLTLVQGDKAIEKTIMFEK